VPLSKNSSPLLVSQAGYGPGGSQLIGVVDPFDNLAESCEPP